MAMKTAWALNSPARDTHSRTKIAIPLIDTSASQWTRAKAQLEGDKRKWNVQQHLASMQVFEKN
jgi:hypothetical protein